MFSELVSFRWAFAVSIGIKLSAFVYQQKGETFFLYSFFAIKEF